MLLEELGQHRLGLDVLVVGQIPNGETVLPKGRVSWHCAAIQVALPCRSRVISYLFKDLKSCP